METFCWSPFWTLDSRKAHIFCHKTQNNYHKDIPFIEENWVKLLSRAVHPNLHNNHKSFLYFPTYKYFKKMNECFLCLYDKSLQFYSNIWYTIYTLANSCWLIDMTKVKKLWFLDFLTFDYNLWENLN